MHNLAKVGVEARIRGDGGIAVQFTSSAIGASFINSGPVKGGDGGNRPGFGGNGGNAIQFDASGTFTANGNTVTGGKGGNGGNGTTGGAGGAALSMISGGTINNPGGALKGGAGGNGGQGGAGGAGVTGNNLTINNTPFAIILGGNGGSGISNGAGGNGVQGNNLTINNTGGTIQVGGGAGGNAIQLTGGTNYVGTGGTINGTLALQSATTFTPALPGSTVGTPLAVTGALTFASTSTYKVRITPTASDSTAVTGTASPGGAKVAVQAGAGTYQARRYTIINATGGVTGRFSTVTTDLAFLIPTLTYDANDVYLNITATGTYTTAASTQNQYNLASGLTNAGMAMPGGAGGQVLGALNQLTVPQAQAAFNALAGEGITAAQNVANRSAQQFNGAIFDQTTFYGSGGAGNSVTLSDAPPAFVALAPEQTLAASQKSQPIRELADLPSSHIAPTFVAPSRTWRAWASGFGGVEDIHGNGAIGSATQNNTIYGGTLGVDYQLTPNYLVGIALGGSDGAFSVPGRTTTGSTTGGHVAFYDLATFGKFYGASSNSFSYYDNKTTRSVAGFGGLGGETERGNFNSHEFRTRLEFGRHIDTYGATLTPFVALEIADLRSNGFGETSITGPGLFRLNVSGQSAADVPGYLGARVQTIMPLGGMAFLPSLQVAWEHEFAPYRSQIGAIADLPGSTFLVTGAQPARDAAQVKVGGELKIGANSAVFANFDGEFSGVNQLYAGKGGFRWLW